MESAVFYLAILIVLSVLWLTRCIDQVGNKSVAVLEQLSELAGRLDELEEKIDSLEQ